MKQKLLVLNHSLLFLCASMYLGTGWSLLLFSFPVAPQLTPATYYLQFVPQVEAATRFFTYMTMLMIVCGIVMTVSEWKTRYRWLPVIVLLGIVGATLLTTQLILPLNAQMKAGIADQATLDAILNRWMSLNRIRVALWTVQWLAMMAFLAAEAYRARQAR
jgi:hypothetical protein